MLYHDAQLHLKPNTTSSNNEENTHYVLFLVERASFIGKISVSKYKTMSNQHLNANLQLCFESSLERQARLSRRRLRIYFCNDHTFK